MVQVGCAGKVFDVLPARNDTGICLSFVDFLIRELTIVCYDLLESVKAQML